MQKPSDFFMQHEDSSNALEDIFIHSDRQEWNFPSDAASVTKSKLDEVSKVGLSERDSLLDAQYLDEPSKQCPELGRTLSQASSLFRNLNSDDTNFDVLNEFGTGCSSSLSDERLNDDTDDLSERTGFSGYLSEGRIERETPLASDSVTIEENRSLEPYGTSTQRMFIEDSSVTSRPGSAERWARKEVQKPPTTAGIGLEDLKAVFHLERPKAEKKLGLKRTTFSNLSRHYGISKWPFRTIRDALNRMEANNRLLENTSVSKERRRKLQRQQKLLHDVINLIYTDPRQSRDSNTLAVLLMIVGAKNSQ